MFELMLVLVIIAIIAAGVAPALSRAMPALAVRSAARMVFASAQRARSEAVARAVPFKLVLDLTERTLRITAETNPLSKPGEFVELAEPWAKRVELPPQAEIEEVSTTGEDDESETVMSGECELAFNPDGTATDARIKIVSSRSAPRWVLVHGITGRVEITDQEPE